MGRELKNPGRSQLASMHRGSLTSYTAREVTYWQSGRPGGHLGGSVFIDLNGDTLDPRHLQRLERRHCRGVIDADIALSPPLPRGAGDWESFIYRDLDEGAGDEDKRGKFIRGWLGPVSVARPPPQPPPNPPPIQKWPALRGGAMDRLMTSRQRCWPRLLA